MKKKSPLPKGKTPTVGAFPYDLTIGMIIKNEKESLARCLKSLQPLRDAVNCQLIITDTGSTDGARELAEEYADLLLDFTWCDDFSAARNTGVAKAQGSWFLYVDSDHELDESWKELAHFIQTSGQNSKIPFASLYIRNYYGSTQGNHLSHSDMTSCLLVNFSQGKKQFQGRIHESIPLPDVTVPHIPCTLHHWGYVDGKFMDKSQRNGEILLQVLEENPNDLRKQLQYLRDLIDPQEVTAHLEKVMTILECSDCKKTPDYDFLSTLCYIFQGDFYLKHQEGEKCDATLTLLRERLETNPKFKGTIVELELRGIGFALAVERKLPLEKKLSYFQEYAQLFYQLQRKPNRNYVIYYDYTHTRDPYFYKTEVSFLQDLLEAQEHEQAETLLNQSMMLNYQVGSGGFPFLKDYLDLCFRVGSLFLIEKAVKQVETSSHKASIYLLEQTIEENRTKVSPQYYTSLMGVIGKKPTNSYTALCHLRFKEYDFSHCSSEVVSLLSSGSGLYTAPTYYEVFYSYVKYKEDPFKYVVQFPLAKLPDMVRQLHAIHEDVIPLVVETFFSDFPLFSIKYQQVWAVLGMEVLVLLCEELEKPQCHETLLTLKEKLIPYFQGVTGITSSYVTTIYNPDILGNEGIDLLSPPEKFGYYGAMAFRHDRESLEFVQTLREVGKLCPAYQKVIFSLVAQLNPNTSTSTKVSSPENTELLALALEVKKNIKGYLELGDTKTAKLLLEKFATIVPNDPDLDQLKVDCGVK